jgi:hypothetical protein
MHKAPLNKLSSVKIQLLDNPEIGSTEYACYGLGKVLERQLDGIITTMMMTKKNGC